MRRLVRPSLRVLALAAALLLTTLATGIAQQASAPTVALENGRWFDGSSFVARTVYSVDGRFSSSRPARIDRTIDLAGAWVVPPFGEAHNHNVDGASEERSRRALARYVADGVLYVKIQGNFPVGDELRRRLPMNRPGAPDVALAQTFVTSTGGHPIPLHENVLLAQGWYPGFTRDRLKDSLYVTIDSTSELDRKWAHIRSLRPDFVKVVLWGSDEFQASSTGRVKLGGRGLAPRVLDRLVARAHADRLRVSAHINSAADFSTAVAAGVDEIVHAGSPSFFNTIEDRMEESQIARDPALATRLLIEALRDTTRRAYEPIDVDDARLAARRGTVVVTTILSVTRSPEPAREAIRPYVAANLRTLRDAGVTLVVGSDNPGDTSALELEQLATLGVFDNLALLKMWSEATPRAIFPGRRIGSLADGYEASFLALEGNPLEDLANLRKIRLRFKQGVELAP